MDENSAQDASADATPIFAAYRRGYDPEQVDRFVADQRRRLDETTHRASEAERRLAAAVGQLRELHRRVAVLESEERTPTPQQAPPLDTLGERVQRILQEAWEGAYALRQSAEQDVNDYREQQMAAGDEIVATARRKAEAIEAEIGKRRKAYVERIESDRARAVKQMTYLHEQRKIALDELRRVKVLIEATVAEVESEARPVHPPIVLDETETTGETPAAIAEEPVREAPPATAPTTPSIAARFTDEGLPQTMPVHRIPALEPAEAPDPAILVRSHRAGVVARTAVTPIRPELPDDDPNSPRSSVFDFEAESSKE